MDFFTETQTIQQLEKNRGGYYYLKISSDLVDTMTDKRSTRLLCTLEGQLTFPCGLNHYGDGHFFIILSGKNLKTLGKELGDAVAFELREDPNPLGVEMPEVLEAVLEQEEELKTLFNSLSMGKKRSVIFSVSRIKDIDKQIHNARKNILALSKPRTKKQ